MLASKLDGEDRIENTSHSWAAADANHAPLALDNAFCQCQAEAGTQNRSGAIQLLEIGEQTRNVGVWNARAGILHLDTKGAAALPAGANLDGAGLDCEFDG